MQVFCFVFVFLLSLCDWAWVSEFANSRVQKAGGAAVVDKSRTRSRVLSLSTCIYEYVCVRFPSEIQAEAGDLGSFPWYMFSSSCY